MSIINLTISKDNIIGDCNVLSVFNPLTFYCDAEFTGIAPENLYWNLKNGDGDILYTGRCIPLEYITISELRFLIDIVPFCKKSFLDLADSYQPTESFLPVANTQAKFTLEFFDSENLYTLVSVDFIGLMSTRQRGQTEANTEIYNNDTEYIIAPAGFPVYAYFWNNDEANQVDVNIESPFEYALDNDLNIYRNNENEKFRIRTKI